MKKVLVISTVGLVYDGITSVIVSYLKAMDLRSIDIFVAGTIEVKPNIERQLEDIGCTVVKFPNRRREVLRYFMALATFIRKNHIDVVHAHGNSGTLAIEMAAAWVGGSKKRIAHSHNTKCDQVRADKLLRPLLYLLYTDALACGEEAGKWLFGKRNFEILANGRDLEKFKFNSDVREILRDKYHIKNEIVIGHVGGFFPQKNHEFLVKIYKEIKKLRPTCKLFMIGDGPLRRSIEKKAAELNVIFTGAVDNVQDYLNVMDGMLLPSLFEGLPLVAIEWQINGLPCVLSDSISRECEITRNVEFLSIDDPAKKWAKIIVQRVENNDRKACADYSYKIIKNSIFNIAENTKKLERLYKR